VGYVTRGSIFGKEAFYGTQVGPTSTGLGWMLKVVNVSITPYTFTEKFDSSQAVLSKDNLMLFFQSHIIMRIDPSGVKSFMEEFSTIYDKNYDDSLVIDAYRSFLRETFRTFCRDEIQKRDGMVVKGDIITIGASIMSRLDEVTKGTPFRISMAVVGNIQYPVQVSNSVAAKLAATQELERQQTLVEIQKKKREQTVIDADASGQATVITSTAGGRGVVIDAEAKAKAIDLLGDKLTPLFIQLLAIKVQELQAENGVSNTIYIPTGPNGVPIVGTLSTDKSSGN